MSAFSSRGRPAEPIDVLPVEDDHRDGRLLRVAFEQIEAVRETRLRAVTGGTEALSVLRRSVDTDSLSPPNLVLLDLGLPNCRGLEVLEAIERFWLAQARLSLIQ